MRRHELSDEERAINRHGGPKTRHQRSRRRIWIVCFMHDDLGYTDVEQRPLQTSDNPFGTRVATHVVGRFCYPCLRV